MFLSVFTQDREGNFFLSCPRQMQSVWCWCLAKVFTSAEHHWLAVGAGQLPNGGGSFIFSEAGRGYEVSYFCWAGGLACCPVLGSRVGTQQTPQGSNTLSVTPSQVWEEVMPPDLGEVIGRVWGRQGLGLELANPLLAGPAHACPVFWVNTFQYHGSKFATR